MSFEVITEKLLDSIKSELKKDEHIVRLHIGLEDPKDLIQDLKRSLRFIK